MESINLSPKLKLSLSTISLNSSLILSNLNEEKIENLISVFSDREKQEIIQLKNPNILFFYLLNYEKFHQILYENDNIVQISSEDLKNKISNYFYLVLLIEKDQEIVNYQYEINVIIDLFNLLNTKSKGEFNDLIIAIIISKLIKNYVNLTSDLEDDEKTQLEQLDKINQEVKKRIEKIKNILKNNNIEIDKENLDDINLEEIYIQLIINKLLKSYKKGKDEDKTDDFTKNFVEQIDLENIELTKIMFDKLKEYFDKEEKEKDYYIPKISTIADLFDINIINYYYYLCKYILKQNIYVYHIDFLNKTKNKIINIINSLYKQLLELPEEKYINKIKQEYVIEFMTNSKYYYKNLNNERQDEQYEILRLKKIIMKNKINNDNVNDNKEIKSKQLIELSNGYFLKINSQNEILIYDYNYNLTKPEKFNKEYIRNISEIENKNGKIKFCIYELNKLYFYEYNINENKLNEKAEEKENPNQYRNIFKIKNKKNNQIEDLSSGALGIYLKDKNIDNDNNQINYIGSLRITDNLFAFYSNEIFQNGKDTIVLFQINIQNINDKNNKNYIFKEIEEIKVKKERGGEEEIKFSFPFYNNALYLINIDDNYKILLCANQSHNSNKKNGIIILKIKTDENGFDTYPNYPAEFYFTDDFEVYCFCLIYEDKNKKFAYFLAGGLENYKKREMIKLYKITYNNINEKAQIDFIQDAIENFDHFEDFDGIINNIIKPNKNRRDIIVNCLEGRTYLFSLAKKDYYI